MNLPFPPSQDDSPRARFRCAVFATRNAFDWSSILVLPGAAAVRSTCSAKRSAACSTLSPIAATRSVTSLSGCHAGLTLLPSASLPQLPVELLRSRRVRDARFRDALRASHHHRFRRRRDDARVGKMPLANLCNRFCCQRALRRSYRPSSDGLTPACPSRLVPSAVTAR